MTHPDQPDRPHQPQAEDEAIGGVLDRLERENRAAARDRAAADLEREVLEVFGLLPFELEPVTPSAAVKRRILEAVGREAVIVPIPATGATARPALQAPRERPSYAQLASAALVVLTLGLAGLSGYLYATLRDERATFTTLGEKPAERQAGAEEAASYRREMETLRANFSLVTSPGVEIRRLEPRDGEPPQPKAQGHLYVAPDRREWLLTAQGLDPCHGEQAYHVWFVTDGGVVAGGFFHVAAGQKIQVGSKDMPAGTRAVIVTLEASETSAEPEGPTVLYGDEPELML